MRERVRQFRDRLSQLEHLHGGAIVTAAATAVLDYLALPQLTSLAIGLVAGIGYRQLRFFLERGTRQQCIDKVGGAATQLLDGWLFSGNLADVTRMSGASIRTLARAARQDRLADALQWTGEGEATLSQLIQQRVNDFERATSHCAGRVWPPRANGVVSRVIARGAVAANAAWAYERSSHTNGSGGALTALGAALTALADDAEDLERVRDAAAAGANAIILDAADAAAAGARIELQEIAVAAAHELLTTAIPAPEELERSSLRRQDATLRDIAEAEAFALEPVDEEMALARWLARIRAAQQAAAPGLAGRGLEMHPRSFFVWLQIRNDGIQRLESAIQRLMGDVHAQRNAAGQFTEEIAHNVQRSREELREAAQQFVTRVDQLDRLEVR